MNDEASHVTNVGHVAVQLEACNKLLAGFYAALDVECEYRAVALAFSVLLRALVPLAGWQACVKHFFNLRMLGKKLANFLRVGPVTIHAERQCFKTLQEVECVVWRCCHSQVAQHLHACLDDVRTCAKRWPICKAVVRRIWFGEVGELVVLTEVECSAVDDCTTD